jgi:hypothetical protein
MILLSSDSHVEPVAVPQAETSMLAKCSCLQRVIETAQADANYGTNRSAAGGAGRPIASPRSGAKSRCRSPLELSLANVYFLAPHS